MSKITRAAKRGFTIIEVSIFLAITALIFVGMIVGLQGSLTQNHYDEDVRSLADFLQNAYSKVVSVENDKAGMSGKAIYGKLITFGEEKNLAGSNNSDQDVFIYDVIGNIDNDNTAAGSTLAALTSLNATVTAVVGGQGTYAGIADSYRARWGTTIETTDAVSAKQKAAVLITRSPSTGTIFTYVKNNGTIEVNSNKGNVNLLRNALINNEFKANEDLNLCINMERRVYGGKRKNIRVEQLSRSSAGVKIVHMDDSDNLCQ